MISFLFYDFLFENFKRNTAEKLEILGSLEMPETDDPKVLRMWNSMTKIPF